MTISFPLGSYWKAPVRRKKAALCGETFRQSWLSVSVQRFRLRGSRPSAQKSPWVSVTDFLLSQQGTFHPSPSLASEAHFTVIFPTGAAKKDEFFKGTVGPSTGPENLGSLDSSRPGKKLECLFPTSERRLKTRAKFV